MEGELKYLIGKLGEKEFLPIFAFTSLYPGLMLKMTDKCKI